MDDCGGMIVVGNNGTYQYLFFHLSDGIIISRPYLKEKLQYL